MTKKNEPRKNYLVSNRWRKVYLTRVTLADARKVAYNNARTHDAETVLYDINEGMKVIEHFYDNGTCAVPGGLKKKYNG